MRSTLQVISLAAAAVLMAFAQATAQTPPPKDPVLTIETGMHIGSIWRSAVNSSCTRLVSSSYEDKTLRLWSLDPNSSTEPELLRTFRFTIGDGDIGKVFGTAISPDGSLLVAGTSKATDRYTGEGQIHVIDAKTGRIIRQLGDSLKVAYHIIFSQDGSHLAATLNAGDGVRVWRTRDWKLVLEDKKYGDSSYGATFDNKGRLWTVAHDGKIRRYDYKSDETKFYSHPKTTETKSGEKPYGISTHPIEDLAAIAFLDKSTVEIINKETLTFKFAAHAEDNPDSKGGFAAVAWMPENKQLIAGGTYHKESDSGSSNDLRVWQQLGRGKGEDFPRATNTIMSIDSCKGKIVFTAQDPIIGILNSDASKEFIKTGVSADVGSYMLHTIPNSREISFGLNFELNRAATFDIDAELLTETVLLSEGMKPADTDSLPLKNWDASYSPKLGDVSIKIPNNDRALSVAISPDLDKFALGANASLNLYDSKGRLIWTKPAPAHAWDVNIPKGIPVVIATYSDGTVRWHRLSDGRELLALFVHADDYRWVMWTPKGYYMASPGGEELIGWHVNNGWNKTGDFFSADRFREHFYRPDIVKSVLDVLDEDKAIAEANRKSGRSSKKDDVLDLLPPLIEILDPAHDGTFSKPEVTLRYVTRSPTGAPITDVEIQIDGAKLNTRAPVPVEAQAEAPIEVDLVLPKRDVTVTLIAKHRDRSSEPASVRLRWDGAKHTETKLPKLRAVIVGISKYEHGDLNLKWAAQDAHDVAKALRNQKDKQYSEVEIELLQNATKADIIDEFQWLEDFAKDDDISLIFLAGHGITDKKQRFFFLPANAEVDRLRSTGISNTELKGVIRAIKGRVVVFMDACHSADGLNSSQGRGPVDMNLITNELASLENGTLMYASSSARQFSYEDDEWKNGAFTEALIEGLAGKADYDGNGNIETDELGLWLRKRVTKLTEKRQTPVRHKSRPVQEFSIATLK